VFVVAADVAVLKISLNFGADDGTDTIPVPAAPGSGDWYILDFVFL
jgi:hypothetical protein